MVLSLKCSLFKRLLLEWCW